MPTRPAGSAWTWRRSSAGTTWSWSGWRCCWSATRDTPRVTAALGIEPAGVRRGDHPAEIIVLDPRTGARATWRGGLAPRGQDQRTLRIDQLSWTADGQQLAYLAAWTCRQPPASARASCPDVGPLGYYEEVRSLAPAGRGAVSAAGGCCCASRR